AEGDGVAVEQLVRRARVGGAVAARLVDAGSGVQLVAVGVVQGVRRPCGRGRGRRGNRPAGGDRGRRRVRLAGSRRLRGAGAVGQVRRGGGSGRVSGGRGGGAGGR